MVRLVMAFFGPLSAANTRIFRHAARIIAFHRLLFWRMRTLSRAYISTSPNRPSHRSASRGAEREASRAWQHAARAHKRIIRRREVSETDRRGATDIGILLASIGAMRIVALQPWPRVVLVTMIVLFVMPW